MSRIAMSQLSKDDLKKIYSILEKERNTMLSWIKGATPSRLNPDSVRQVKELFPKFPGFYPSDLNFLRAMQIQPKDMSRGHVGMKSSVESYLVDFSSVPKQVVTGQVTGAPLEKIEVAKEVEEYQVRAAYVTSKIRIYDPAPCCEPGEKSLGKANEYFVRDLVFLTNFSDESVSKMVPSAQALNLAGAGFKDINYEALSNFCQSAGDFGLTSGYVKGMTVLDIYRVLRHAIRNHPEIATVRHVFYSTVFEVEYVGPGKFKVKKSSGINPISDNEVARTQGRSGQVKSVPLNIQCAILADERAVRGENSKKSNFFGQFSYRGMFATPDRMNVCDALSIFLAVRKISNETVVISLASEASIPMFIAAMSDYEATNYKVYCWTDYEKMSEKHVNLIVCEIKPTDILIDLSGCGLPEMKKKEVLADRWTSNLDNHIKKIKASKFICLLKVCGEYMRARTEYRYFKFHSSHAFDCLVVKGIEITSRVVKRYKLSPNDLDEKSLPMGRLEDEILQVAKPATWNERCMNDSRRRTLAFLNKDYVKFDYGLNLAACAKALSKKERRKLQTEFIEAEEFEFADLSNAEDDPPEQKAPDPIDEHSQSNGANSDSEDDDDDLMKQQLDAFGDD